MAVSGWDLEAGSGAEVAAVDERLSEMGSHPSFIKRDHAVNWIVSAIGGKVVVRRFDI